MRFRVNYTLAYVNESGVTMGSTDTSNLFMEVEAISTGQAESIIKSMFPGAIIHSAIQIS